jgi:hypothetical protein
MKAVHILVRSDGVEQRLGVDLRGQRQLDENAVDLVAGVELGHQSSISSVVTVSGGVMRSL